MGELKKDADEWLSIRLDDIPDPLDKFLECRYFFRLLETEADQSNFRWLMSAFLSAAYSFFETVNFCAHKRYLDEVSSSNVECEEMLNILKNYVLLGRKGKGDRGFTTSAALPLLERLYMLRNLNTHRSALLIKTNGSNLPIDFMIGFVMDDDVPALEFCKEVVAIIEEMSEKLQDVL